jgi:ATP-dependent Lhr-like helicase
VLAHEILTARPYAFLDGEGEVQNRRTNAVALRRGLSVDVAAIGALEPDAIDRVHAEIVADPSSPDDLHDLLASLVVAKPRPEWQPLWDALAERGRVQTVDQGTTTMWVTVEARDEARRAYEGDDAAVVAVVRGHLEIAGLTTVPELADATTLPAGRVTSALAVLEHEGFALQGRYSSSAVETEWVARRLLARMHSYSRRSRRDGIEPVTAQDFMRFLVRWHHVAPSMQLAGEGGLVTVLEQLQGYELAAVAWEPHALASRLRGYAPAMLDRLCHEGQITWLRLRPRPRDDGSLTAGAPSKATPISIVFRDDLEWLVAASRADAHPAEPATGATAEVLEVLRSRGACFAADLVSATRRLPDDIERAVWDGVSRGLLTADGFGAIRSRVNGGGRRDTRRLSRLTSRAIAASSGAGRWSLVPRGASEIERHELAEAVAELLLRRWGVVFRDLAAHDSLPFPWRDVQWALRRLEDRGLVRGGRFVTGFSGEQYALPEAVEQLTHVRKLERSGERVTVNATDPLNLVGVVLPGPAVPAIRTNSVTYVDGLLEA